MAQVLTLGFNYTEILTEIITDVTSLYKCHQKLKMSGIAVAILIKKPFKNYFLRSKALRDPPQSPLKRGKN
jgi:hypothetical protein